MILRKRWETPEKTPKSARKALDRYSEVMGQILYNRGYRDAEAAQRFIQAIPPEGALPANLLGMAEATERIRSAMRKEQTIAIYGDYDVDGVTATALLTQTLRRLGANVRGYIPNRFEEGYGLNTDALAALYDEGVRLVVTVDCGIRSPEEVAFARELGIDMIITDHHSPGGQLPEATAVINPKQPGDAYPDKNLAGVGLAYKLAQSLLEAYSIDQAGGLHEADLLDLVALGTVADIAPLVGENRSLVRSGLESIRYPRRQGVLSLIGVAGLVAAQITAENIGFALGPRLNAAGRLDSALAALDLLLSEDVTESARLAQQLDNQNRERQQITRTIQEHAEQVAIAEDPEALLLFTADPSYNPGVVGLAASRLVDAYYRPGIVAHMGEATTRGSCRSIPEFHITEALDQCADLLEHHGGHAAAAGFTVRNENLPELIERLKAIAQDQLGGLDLQPVLHADMEIALSDLKPDILHDLALLEPTGSENPRALFISRDLQVKRCYTVGRDDAHLKLSVSDGRIVHEAIAFRQGHWVEEMPERIDILYAFELNEFKGRQYLQLNIQDIKPAVGY